jgi:hypothetical protein
MPKFLGTNQISLELFFLEIFLVILCKNMSAGSSQHSVRQRIEEGIVAFRARIANRPAIPERNVVRADVLVAPMDVIDDIIQTYH